MKYIDAEKLIAEIERLKERAQAERVLHPKTILAARNYLLIQDYDNLLPFIASLQQEQPETPSGEEVMTMCNQILIDWVKEGKTPEEREQREQAHIRFFELYDEYMQEQPEVDFEKEELVGVAESPLKTFPRVNEFDCGSSYRH